ncbi:hypothetical protein KP509_1Z047100 [Ceratopteris richardii]|nr:hypothetical protein KP509_1Z047100 [Ceratopteris richardii]
MASSLMKILLDVSYSTNAFFVHVVTKIGSEPAPANFGEGAIFCVSKINGDDRNLSEGTHGAFSNPKHLSVKNVTWHMSKFSRNPQESAGCHGISYFICRSSSIAACFMNRPGDKDPGEILFLHKLRHEQRIPEAFVWCIKCSIASLAIAFSIVTVFTLHWFQHCNGVFSALSV